MHIRKHAQTQGTAMAKLTKAQTVASVRNVLYSYKKKIESVMYDTDKLLPEAQTIVDDYRSDNGIIQNLMKKALDENSSFFEDMDTSLLLQYAQTCYELNTLFDLKVPNLPKITAITEEEKNYSFENGQLYINAKNTGITISQMFEQLFPETNYTKDKDFYTKICNSCLGIENPDKINGEYRVNLKNDYNDNTKADGVFGKLMREKYIYERYMTEGETGRKKGYAILKQFDEQHGTSITKSEKNTYSQTDAVYNALIPKNQRAITQLCEFINDITLTKLLDSSYIGELKSKAKEASAQVSFYLLNWVEILRKIHLENIDKFELSDTEIMGFIRAVSVIKDKAQQFALLFLGITMPTSVGFVTQQNALESFLTRQYERTRFAKLLGFTYTGNDTDYYYTQENSLQSKFGFMDAYDESGDLLGMDLQDTVIVFPYKDKEYRVEFWCGRYAYGNAYGAEIGVYYRPLSDALEKPYREKEKDSRFIYYECVPEGEQFVMELNIKVDTKNGQDQILNKTAEYAKNGDHFWNLAIRTSQLKNINDMHVKGYIFTKNPELFKVMEYAISRKLKCGYKDSFLEVIIKE